MVVKSRRSLHEWLVYGSVFIVMMAVLSIVHTIGMLFPFFLDEFGESRAKMQLYSLYFSGLDSVQVDCRPYLNFEEKSCTEIRVIFAHIH